MTRRAESHSTQFGQQRAKYKKNTRKTPRQLPALFGTKQPPARRCINAAGTCQYMASQAGANSTTSSRHALKQVARCAPQQATCWCSVPAGQYPAPVANSPQVQEGSKDRSRKVPGRCPHWVLKECATLQQNSICGRAWFMVTGKARLPNMQQLMQQLLRNITVPCCHACYKLCFPTLHDNNNATSHTFATDSCGVHHTLSHATSPRPHNTIAVGASKRR